MGERVDNPHEPRWEHGAVMPAHRPVRGPAGVLARGAVGMAALLGVLTSGCVYLSPSVGAVRASQTTTGDRGAPYLYVAAGFRTTSDAPIRCGGGVGHILTGNSYGNGHGVGPEARCNFMVAEAGYNRRWAVFTRAMFGWGWLNDPEREATVARGSAAVGFAGVSYEMLSDPESVGVTEYRPVSLDLAFGITATRLAVDDAHYSWIGVGLEGTGSFDLIYYLDRSGNPD